MIAKAYDFKVMEDGSAYALARVKKKDSSHNMVIVSTSDFSTISRSVYDSTTVVIGPTTLTVADTILNALSTGTIWTIDSTGFNFIDLVPSTAFPTGGTTYRLEYKFTLTGGEIFHLPINATAISVSAS